MINGVAHGTELRFKLLNEYLETFCDITFLKSISKKDLYKYNKDVGKD